MIPKKNAETEVWLNFAKDCEYLSTEEFDHLTSLNEEAGKLIWYMINHPEKFL
jgi:four helix bundle protein